MGRVDLQALLVSPSILHVLFQSEARFQRAGIIQQFAQKFNTEFMRLGCPGCYTVFLEEVVANESLWNLLLQAGAPVTLNQNCLSERQWQTISKTGKKVPWYSSQLLAVPCHCATKNRFFLGTQK